MIRAYFTQIKTILDQYATTAFVLEVAVNFETRPGDQGYLTGTVIFVDDSTLHFSEYLDQVGDRVDKLMYTYHYQSESNQLIFRYDNAHHRPPLPSPEHKHLSTEVIEASAPTLDDVLAEIVVMKGWV